MGGCKSYRFIFLYYALVKNKTKIKLRHYQQMDDKENYRERFIRWQAIAIEQRGKAMNVLLSLSLATIAFLANQIMNNHFQFKTICAEYFMGGGSFFLLSCIVITLLLHICRLKDFDQTKNIIKARIQHKPQTIIIPMQTENRSTGKLTKCGFNISVWCFLLGEIFVVIGLILQIKGKF